MRAKRIGVTLAVGLVVLAIPTMASAATQIGQTFDPTGSNAVATRTVLAVTTPGAQYAAPFAGVITAWSYQAAANPPDLKLKVARAAGGVNYTIVGESTVQAPPPNGTSTFATRIPVEAGDLIGFTVTADGQVARAAPGYSFRDFIGDPPPGTTVATGGPFVNVQLDISAALEPDCDNDGFGDETQDSELPVGEACGKGTRTLTLDANKNKVKKGKKVTLSGRIAETRQETAGCVVNQVVELQRKKPSQTAFTTIEQLQTDAAGSFSAKVKVKKTFQYRAQVPETATCGPGLSNTEKVKIKKKQ
jgi:hypothetical protein